jgi:hypothetical protein
MKPTISQVQSALDVTDSLNDILNDDVMDYDVIKIRFGLLDELQRRELLIRLSEVSMQYSSELLEAAK